MSISTRKEQIFVNEIASLLRIIKRETHWPELVTTDDIGQRCCFLDVTVGADDTLTWDYQTGDNSFTGGAYVFPHWGTSSLSPRCNCKEVAREIAGQILENIAHRES